MGGPGHAAVYPPPATNTLFYEDNLIILREHIASESVDLDSVSPLAAWARGIEIKNGVHNYYW